MQRKVTSPTRTFKSEPAPASESATLIAPETWQDPGQLRIGEKQYGFRCYPGHAPAGCTRIVRLFQGDGFADESYDISFHVDQRPLCTCADFIFGNKADTDTTCKHIRAVVALDLHTVAVPARVADGKPDLPDSDLELFENPDAPN